MIHFYLTFKLLHLADHSQAVIACRVSPKQKQEVVTLVRKHVTFYFFNKIK